MDIQIKSITIYIRADQFDRFLRCQCESDYVDIKWSLTSGEPQTGGRHFKIPQVQVQLTLSSYHALCAVCAPTNYITRNPSMMG
jgi:hypothetical protein